ncbi:MAG: hypothetical protein ACRD9R_13315 [Pyrinomonadaceae bacterium]
MTRLSRSAAAAVYLLAASLPFHAQVANKPGKTNTTATGRERAARGATVDPLAAERRATALTLVNALAEEARAFRDVNLRARVQAQSANALWDSERERATGLFRRAWAAAEEADRENDRRREEERRRARDGRGGPVISMQNIPNVRGEVLRLAAKRDHALGEEFLGRLEEARRQQERDAQATPPAPAAAATGDATAAQRQGPERSPLDTPPAASRRLSLALQFLNDGDTERALQFAEPALTEPYQMTVEFLATLRGRDAAVADARFTALAARAAAAPDSDANTVLLLSSYVLTPHLYMTFERGGGISSTQRRRDGVRPDLPAPVRQAFIDAAAQILLRPAPPLDQDRSTSGRDGTYFTIARLLPFVEQFDPEKVALLRTQMAALAPDLTQRERGPDFERDLQRGLVPEDSQGDRTQEMLDRAAKETDPAQRNELYAMAALSAARQGDARALDLADKIDDTELRRQVRAFVQFSQLNQAIQNKDGAEVLRLVTNAGDITRPQRTWGYTEAARLLVKSDRGRAIEALEAAAAEARRIDAEDPDRVRSTVAVATQFFELDRNRAWEIMAEAVKASNGAVEYSGADAGLAVAVRTRSMGSVMNFSAPSFDLTPVFTTLAKDDMNRAIELAKGFQQESPRAVATLAIARAILEKQ